nr:helix-turn-helix domain-containing protein [Exiguobacterium sp. s57]
MSYSHLTTTERVKIETYLELGMSIRSIARRLGRQPSAVSREIRRNPGSESGRAQRRYEKAKANCGAKTKLDDTMRRTFGHWALDTVVSGRGKSKACVATFIERKSRFYPCSSTL